MCGNSHNQAVNWLVSIDRPGKGEEEASGIMIILNTSINRLTELVTPVILRIEADVVIGC